MSARGEAPVAVVTGAAGGIGRAIVTGLTDAGHRVAAVDRVAGSPGPGIQCHLVDVTDPVAVADLVAAVEAELGPIEVLVNAAGLLRVGDVLTTGTDDFAAMLAVNAQAVGLVSRAVAARMVPRRRGCIVTVSSNAAGVPRAGMAAYGASKAAATLYTKSLGLELAGFGIRCNVVAPGTTRTPMLATVGAGTGLGIDEVAAAAIAGDPGRYKVGIPLGRVADPDDIASAVVFLASDAARHITMQELYVDGGATLR